MPEAGFQSVLTVYFQLNFFNFVLIHLHCLSYSTDNSHDSSVLGQKVLYPKSENSWLAIIWLFLKLSSFWTR